MRKWILLHFCANTEGIFFFYHIIRGKYYFFCGVGAQTHSLNELEVIFLDKKFLFEEGGIHSQ